MNDQLHRDFRRRIQDARTPSEVAKLWEDVRALDTRDPDRQSLAEELAMVESARKLIAAEEAT